MDSDGASNDDGESDCIDGESDGDGSDDDGDDGWWW